MEFRKTEKGFFSLSGIDTLKIGTAAKAVNHIDYSGNVEDIRKNEKNLLRKITNITEKNILMLNQLHEDCIVVVDDYPKNDILILADADGIITNKPELCVVVRSADCVPVFAFDPNKRVLGTAHSGWRGCALSISKKLIIKMNQIFSSDYNDILIFILPSIGPDSYTINTDVASLFKRDLCIRDDRIYLNLWSNIENSLMGEGIPEMNIFNTGICTLQEKNEYFSYRNRDSGRNLNFGYF